ncbi:Transcription initiation factor TFIID subunit 1 [Portunus trituberculatus]|uniref:Transcription initiation factor TFIID subunit 1 n=1 Tax=Portunus trituberculatus TaxID=210409 RepID=A0A5B7HJY8_PORTR|nr:Transcription initiation factor TFIID subunit 1 [Portunus trituberculatus]
MQESWPFMKPVNKKNVKDYYEIIQSPMDLSTIAKKVKNHKYHSRAEFMQDMELILTNSIRYNGQDSAFTQKAETLLQVCKDSLAEYEAHLDGLEKKITLAQERALEQAETDSLCTSLGPDDDTNYTFAEPEQDPPDHQMGSPSDNLLNYSGDEEEEHVNVVDGEEEEMMQTPKRRRLQQEQRNVLEEGKFDFFNMQSQRGQKGETGEYNPEGLGTEGNMEVDASYDPSVEFLGGMMPSQVSYVF